MGHSSIRLKVRRRKVAHLRAYSKQFTVRNNCIPNANVEYTLHHDKEEMKNAITCPFTGHKFVPTNPHPVEGKFGIVITGYDWVPPVRKLWKIPKEGYPQPEHLHHAHKGEKWYKYKDGSCKLVKWHHKSQLTGSVSIKMNRVEYMEAYVQQKLDKWVRKNPAPIKDDTQPDIFEQEFMVPWKQAKDLAEERIRDFVVSVYDKLHLVGRYKTSETGTTTFRNKKVADIKDKTGEGHNINELDPEKSPLLKKAQKLTNEEKARDVKLVATTLKDHKQKKGRIILPKAA